MNFKNSLVLRHTLLPALGVGMGVILSQILLSALFPRLPLSIIVSLGVLFLFLGVGAFYYYEKHPVSRGRFYHKVIEGFGDPNRLYLLLDKHYNVLFYSPAMLKLFPHLPQEGLKAIYDELDGEYSQLRYQRLLKNAGRNKNYLTEHLCFKNCYLQVSVYEFLNEGILFLKIEDLMPVKEKKSFLNGNSFLDRVKIDEVFDHTPVGIVLLDHSLLIQGFNRTFSEKFLKGQAIEAGMHIKTLVPSEKQSSLQQALMRVLEGSGGHAQQEIQFFWEDEPHNIMYASIIKQDSLPNNGILIYLFDNHEQKKLQLHLMQSQKLQALGQLAGGIAHDFNNLLTAMIGFCDLLLSRHFPGDQSFTDIMQIKQNANRAANLVRQLLAFSRQQALQPRILDVSEVLSNLSVLLQRLIGVSINLKIVHGRDLGVVKVDQGQFERVIINLVVNARDAIKDHGEIIIRTSNAGVDLPLQINLETVPIGNYVLVEVIDNGSGISPEHVNKVFDPFFSTKEMGSGTGLGLSTVYGIIKQTDGFISAESDPGHCTKFTIYLPRHAESQEQVVTSIVENSTLMSRDLTGIGVILLVEDEDAVRLFSARALRDKGYEVIEASTGEEGLHKLQEMKRSGDKKIDLLITDIVMPHMDGPTLANRALLLSPEIKIIFISGYAEDSFRKKLRQDGDIHFLPKPFNLKELAKKVKEVMELEQERVA